MLLRIILILAISLSLISCKEDAPKFPDVKYHYMIYLKDNDYFCIRYTIKSLSPYELGETEFFPLEECNLVSGYKSEDMKAIIKWKEDTEKWVNKKLSECRVY